MSSLRVSDTIAEKTVAKFLDSNFYKHKTTDFHRFKSRENQLKGKDVTFSLENLKNIIVDEKAQIHYVNRPLPTFAFEINFKRGTGALTEGWLFDKSKETKYYFLIWITASQEKGFSAEEIFELDCLLIKRQDVIDYLDSLGLDYDKVKQISQEIRENDIKGPHMKGKFDYCYFFFTKHLSEKPINIVIRREKLEELATKKIIVKPILPSIQNNCKHKPLKEPSKEEPTSRFLKSCFQ